MFSVNGFLAYMSLRTSSPTSSASSSPTTNAGVVEYHPLSSSAPSAPEEILHKSHPRIHEIRKASLDGHIIIDAGLGQSKLTSLARDEREKDQGGRSRRNTVSGGQHRQRVNTREIAEPDIKLKNMQSHPRLDNRREEFIPPLVSRERDPVSREPTPHRELAPLARENIYRDIGPPASARDNTIYPEATSPGTYIPRGSPPRDPIHREPTPRDSGRTRTRDSSRVREGSRARSNTVTSNHGSSTHDQVRTLMSANEKLSAQLLDMQLELAESRKRTVDALKRVSDLAEERMQAMEQLDTAKTEAAAKERATQQRITELEMRTRKRDEEIRNLSSGLRSAEDRLKNTTKLLEARTADLTGAQAFIGAADVYSGAEIISMVEGLNAEVMQLAALMADFLEDPVMHAFTAERAKMNEKNKELLENEIRPILGEELFTHIENKYLELRKDPFPLQLALQAILCAWCDFKIRTFASGHIGDVLKSLYEHIRSSEAQSVAGRWRALTSMQMKYFDNELPINRLIDYIVALLQFAGWSFTGSKSRQAILSVQEKVHNLERLWIQLKNATKDGVTTSDLETFIFPANIPFDDGMENYYSADKRQGKVNGQKTLCTVAMGLRRSLIVRSEGGVLSPRNEILVKPKVILATALALDGESKTPG